MRRGIIFIPLIVMSSYFGNVFAQEITYSVNSGQASAKSEVYNNINGNGNIETNIKVEANGEIKELKATGSGEYKLEVNSSKAKSEVRSSSTASAVTSIPKLSKIQNINKKNDSFFNRVTIIKQRIVRILQELF